MSPAKRRKPKKPYEGYPLFPHANGLWAKKVKGRLVYFGPWRDPDAALQKWLDQRDALMSGRTPRAARGGLTIRGLCNRFLSSKKRLVVTGELVPRTFRDYHACCGRLVEVFGPDRLVDDLAADDFEHLRAYLATTRGPEALGVEINRCRVAFKYAYDSGLIDKPLRYGQSFERPSQKSIRAARNGHGPRMFEPDQIRQLLEMATVPMRAMILLGCNAALGNHDCGSLPRDAIDLESGWLTFPRPKTQIDRRAPLWPETVQALREVAACRPKPRDKADTDLVFLTASGRPWARDNTSPITDVFRKMLDKSGVYRPGLGFYALRHTFLTIAEETKDFPAVACIMGHTDPSMAARYREKISDARLLAVVNHVRIWLFKEGGA